MTLYESPTNTCSYDVVNRCVAHELRSTCSQKLRFSALKCQTGLASWNYLMRNNNAVLEQNNKERVDCYQQRAMSQSVPLHKRHDCWEKEHSSIDKHVDSSFSS